MTILWITIVFLFVAAVLAIVAYALYESTPFPHRTNPYRDGAGHHRPSPHLDDRHDFD
jgi:hypothetical protein